MNTLAAAVELIEAIDGVSSAYGGRLPGGKNLFPCAMIRRIGGASPIKGETAAYRVELDIFCYGDDQPAAEALADSINEKLLNRESHESANYRCHAREIVGPQDLTEQITDEESWDNTWLQIEMSIFAK